MDFRVQAVVPEPPLKAVNVIVTKYGDEDVGLVVRMEKRADLHDICHRDRWPCPTRTIPWAIAGGRRSWI